MISPVIFDLVKQEIKVGSKQIEAWWSVELEQDLAMMHGVFLRDSITSLCKIIKGQYSGMIGLATYHEISVTIENILIKDSHGTTINSTNFSKDNVTFDLTSEEQMLAAERYFEELL